VIAERLLQPAFLLRAGTRYDAVRVNPAAGVAAREPASSSFGRTSSAQTSAIFPPGGGAGADKASARGCRGRKTIG